MQIRSLSLTNFRCFRRAEIEFSDSLNLFYGNNAQGKTSILEAVHFISLLTSPLASHDRELLYFGILETDVPVSRIVAEIEKGGNNFRIEIRLILDRTLNGINRLKKEVLVNGVKKRLYDAVGIFNSVLFLPQMTRIIEDGPDERRKYLNQMLSQAYPGYVQALNDYQKVLVKRNALLKQLFENGGDPQQLDFWDELIANNGAFIMQARTNAIGGMDLLIREKHRELTMGSEELTIQYSPTFPTLINEQMNLQLGSEGKALDNIPEEEIRELFLQNLIALRNEEIRRGHTTIGPHRDDIIFMLNGIDLGKYGSRGQIRSAVMSLKFAEKEWLEQKTQEKPVMLLDETLAELDKSRRDGLVKILNHHSQAVLATADLENFPDNLIIRCKVWKVYDHKVSVENQLRLS
jgi:DNA replication and repair protein RecF